MIKGLKSLAILTTIFAITAVTMSTNASARLPNQRSLGGGVKCFAVPVTQADGSVVYTPVCRKVGV
jgi:hypothetical protein